LINKRNPNNEEYGELIAKKYYDKLFKEFAIIDLSRYKTGQIGMRWRTKEEVVNGKGDTICANKACSDYKDLTSWEVNFKYQEESL
jgi:protein FRA10AC1